jgi:hypothetical protein
MLPTLQLVLDAQKQPLLQLALSFLQRWNLALMQDAAAHGRPYPRLTRRIAIYRPDPAGVEVWQPADVLRLSRRGNCDSFAAYEAAWLQLHGFPEALAKVEKSPVGYHCVVFTKPGGLRVDPSKRLGMP